MRPKFTAFTFNDWEILMEEEEPTFPLLDTTFGETGDSGEERSVS